MAGELAVFGGDARHRREKKLDDSVRIVDLRSLCGEGDGVDDADVEVTDAR